MRNLASVVVALALVLTGTPFAGQSLAQPRAISGATRPSAVAASPVKGASVVFAAPVASMTQPFTLYGGEPTKISLPVNKTGTITASATWSGPALKLRLEGPAGFSQEASGVSPLTLTHVVTAAEAGANALWTVSLTGPGATPAKAGSKPAPYARAADGTITITTPVPDPVQADAAVRTQSRFRLPDALAQRISAPPVARPSVAAAVTPTAPTELYRPAARAKVELKQKRPGLSVPQLPAPHIDRITNCIPEYPSLRFTDLNTLAHPLGWVLVHGTNLGGRNAVVHEVPTVGAESRPTSAYTGEPTSDSLLVICVMRGSACHVGSPGMGEIYVENNGQLSNRLPFRFPGMQPFTYVVVPQVRALANDVSLSGDGSRTSSGSKWDQDDRRGPWGFDWRTSGADQQSARDEERREFWEACLVWHKDIPENHSATLAGQTVSWKTSNSDRGTDTFYANVELPPGFKVVDARVVENFGPPLLTGATVAEVNSNSRSLTVKVNWWRAPFTDASYSLQIAVSGSQHCDPEYQLIRR